MSTGKSLELETATKVLHTKLNDADFSNKLSQIVDPSTGLIQGTKVNYNDLLTIVNSWQTMLESATDLDKITIFIGEAILQNAINSLTDIFNRFNQYDANPNNIHSIVDSKGSIENLKSYMIHFVPYFKNKNATKIIEEQWKFTKEKEQINKYLDEAKKIVADLQQKSKAINEFHQKLTNDNIEVGIKKYIEDSYDKITQKYNELFVTNKQSKIGEQDVSAVGEIGMVDLFVKDVYSKQKEVTKLVTEIDGKKEEIENLKIDFNNQLEGNKEKKIKGIKESKTEYETTMKVQQDSIDKMTVDTRKALGNHVEALMVKTFQDEAFWKKIESWFMMFLSLVSLGLIGYLGYQWLNSEWLHSISSIPQSPNSKNIPNPNDSENTLRWIGLIFRLSVFIPLGFAFWFCNKRHDMLSLLSAEYRYKQSICEAMIGYRARYENNEGGFSENLAKEYAMFFEKTFDEINKNPAEKINKMLMKNNLSAKEILNILEKHSTSKKDEDSTKKRA